MNQAVHSAGVLPQAAQAGKTPARMHTFGLIFKGDTHSATALAARRASSIEMIMRFMRAP